MEMDSLDNTKCQKSRRDTLGIKLKFNNNKTKDEQCSSSPFESQNVKDEAVGANFVF